MKKYLFSLVAVSVAGSTTIDTAQAQASISPEETQHKQSSDFITHENRITVNADALRVRKGPSTSDMILGLVSNQQSLPVVDEANGWYKIKYNNRDAYVHKDYTIPNHVKVNTTTLRIRTGPSTSHSTLGLVGEGEILQVIKETDGWYKIKYNNRDAYVSKDYVSVINSAGKSKKSTVDVSGSYTVNVSSLRIRTGPNVSHQVLGVLNKGQVVQVVGEVQDWYKIKFNGKVAYINKDYVSLGTDNTSRLPQSEQTKSVQKDGAYIVDATVLRVRTGPANHYPVIGGALKGQHLQVVDVENDWYKIKYNNHTGYVSHEFVKFVKGKSAQEQEKQGKDQQTPQEREKQEQDQQTPQEQEKQEQDQQTSQEQEKQGKDQQTPQEQEKQGKDQQTPQEQEKQGKDQQTPQEQEKQGKDQQTPQEQEKQEQRPSESNVPNNENRISGFIKPAAGSYSSGFGKRDGHMHYGLDIAASGNVPVVAAADGIATRSYYSASYGNVVFISHNINGQTYTTVYAHLNSRSVSVGQSVKQGQQIGIMGNTGQSEGQHLHFEIHKGEWNDQKSNAVDPKLYIK
ncbi:peptidase M23 [Bacillus thuringiensis serovar medellin]|uniref:Peptidase M23 n=1 Tax=Bacillus thuringiensis subsp. medellin TaxID=79672 RepID=A0A9X6MPG5_BACTV|nr:SH3 domain-containing protein [Bacillus thuringiensis]OUB85373.1 peptidase M23 [Bacillus thuringiensis serovar medellin]